MFKPPRLSAKDKVAIVSPSWAGPHTCPDIFELGLHNLRKYFSLNPVEYPTARISPEEGYHHPEIRAEDINNAFADPEIKAIIASIGGDDSVRILPYLDKDLILKNPKIIMGYSDSTTFLSLLNTWGLITFHGPSIMAGFAQLAYLPASFTEHIRQILFTDFSTLEYHPYSQWSEGYMDWAEISTLGQVKNLQTNTDTWHWLQGNTVASGKLFGGCIEVLEMMKGTAFWPQTGWEEKILFFETSEDMPSPTQVMYFLRNYGMQGIFNQIQGLIFGRARGYSLEQKAELDKVIVQVVAEEFHCSTIPIITNMDFGHTDPQLILPLGAEAEIDCKTQTFTLLQCPTT